MSKIVSFFLALVMYFIPTANVDHVKAEKENWTTDYAYVYCHGLSGWGSYDIQYAVLPYWGMFGGDMIKNLNKQGFKCYSASVDPQGSAWDRACELYAQLMGTKVDYGKAHSEKYGHDRFGTDYSKKRLIPAWSSKDKVNLLGHSFGGVTIRLLAELMAYGSADEIQATSEGEISQLFTGGKADWVYSITTLAAPTNGTTAYGFGDPEFMENKDCAAYDMYIDNALAINENISTQPITYYFAIPCSSTNKTEQGIYVADTELTESMFVSSANEMGQLMGTTPKGFVCDETWLENDGLVNTVSAGAPLNAPSQALDKSAITPGVWNVAEVYRGDHMAFNGDLFKTNNIRPFFADWMNMINSIK